MINLVQILEYFNGWNFVSNAFTKIKILKSRGWLFLHFYLCQLCDTASCQGRLQTLWLCFYSNSSLKPVHTFSSVSDSTIQAVKKKSKTISLIELEQQQKKIDSKKRHCPFCCLHGWSFSLCVLLSPPRSSSLSLASLPAVFNGWVEAGKKKRVSETDSGKKKDEEDEDGRDWGREGSHLQAGL